MADNNFVVIFDLDYTLWNHIPLSEQAWNIARYLKIPYIEGFSKQIVDFWASDCRQDVIVTKSSIGKIAEDKIPHLAKCGAKGEDFLEAMTMTDTVWLNKGATELLEFLKNKGTTIVAYTDWFLDYQIFLLKENKIYNYFDYIYTWDNTYEKPNKERVQSLASKFSEKQFVYIGDSLYRDMKSAKNIENCISIWYTNKYHENDLDIDYHTDDLLSIIDYLKGRGLK